MLAFAFVSVSVVYDHPVAQPHLFLSAGSWWVVCATTAATFVQIHWSDQGKNTSSNVTLHASRYRTRYVFCSQVSKHSKHESRINFLQCSSHLQHNALRGFKLRNSLCACACAISTNSLWTLHFLPRRRQERIRTFTVVVFLDQIKKTYPRPSWLYRWAVRSSSNETSESLICLTKYRNRAESHKRHIRICFSYLKITVIGNVMRFLHKSSPSPPRLHIHAVPS